MKNKTILIVDDEKHTREGLRASLEDDFEVYAAADVAGATGILETESVDLLLTDLRLGADDGMKLIDLALKMPTPPVCIMMTAYGSVDTAVEAMKRGAYDFVTKPVNLDKLEILIRRALRGKDVEIENRELRQQVEKRSGQGLEQLIGRSLVMETIYDTVRQVAPTRATVLIEGESGTGKELVARALHSLSNRSKARYVAVHCAALNAQLLESELFGHERGAYTGATERRVGRFEQADGGTLFLDEIGEIDASTQVKLLRALGERSFERVGGNQTITADVRVVAATNKNLERLVSEGKFREDLFYRLNVVRVYMPPLRERREDIPLLVSSFIKQSCVENEKPVRELTADATSRLLEYPWPGNVRELRAAVDHGVVLATGPKITLRDLPRTLRQWGGEGTGGFESAGASGSGGANRDLLPSAAAFQAEKVVPAGYLNVHQAEETLIRRALEETGGNITEAAKKLGISRRTLHRKLKTLPGFPPPPDGGG